MHQPPSINSGLWTRCAVGRHALAGLLMIAFLSACKTGPDYEPPVIEMPEQFDAADDGRKDESAPPVEADSTDAWWESFEDPVLSQYIEEGLVANHDLQISLQRIRATRALRQIESSSFWPEIDARAGYTVDRISANNPRFGEAVREGFFPRDVEYWDLGFDVNWELDVFGGTRRRVEAAASRIEAEEFNRRGLMLSVAAEIARNYLEVLGYRQRSAMLAELIANEEARTAILKHKQASGLIPTSRVLQSQARRQQLRALAPGIRAEMRAGEYRLATLIGRRPGETIEGLEDRHALPKATGQVPVGLPSDLLRRRPDILAAERRLGAATADIGVATSEFFPRFYLTGSPNLQSSDFSDLFTSASTGWLYGPKMSWNIFSAGRNRAQLEAAKATEEQVFIEYEATVNGVLEEVESSLVRYAGDAESLGLLAESTAIQLRNFQIQTLRNEKGIVDRLEVVDSHSALIDARMVELDQQVLLLTRLVNLHKALGGGWETGEQIALESIPPDQSVIPQ